MISGEKDTESAEYPMGLFRPVRIREKQHRYHVGSLDFHRGLEFADTAFFNFSEHTVGPASGL